MSVISLEYNQSEKWQYFCELVNVNYQTGTQNLIFFHRVKTVWHCCDLITGSQLLKWVLSMDGKKLKEWYHHAKLWSTFVTFWSFQKIAMFNVCSIQTDGPAQAWSLQTHIFQLIKPTKHFKTKSLIWSFDLDLFCLLDKTQFVKALFL